jgi:hypothetical protein
MTFKSATVTIEQKDIEEAIRQRVIAAGWQCGKVALHCHPHQHNGPDSFTATAEVQPVLTKAAMSLPITGEISACKSCGKSIRWDGLCWEHVHPPAPRHPATPVSLDR